MERDAVVEDISPDIVPGFDVAQIGWNLERCAE
jgi:hypothetical protein